MNAIIDTSSLRALVRYYLPFDKDNALKELLKDHFVKGRLIIIDKVVGELRFQSGGKIYKELEFITKESALAIHVTKTDTLIPYPKFIRRVDENFCHKEVVKSKNIPPEQYELLRNNFLESADAKIIQFAHEFMKRNLNVLLPETIVVVSEESSADNDGKLFKKIPVICKQMEIEYCTLPDLFKVHYKLNLSEFFH